MDRYKNIMATCVNGCLPSQLEISNLEKTRSIMAEELVKLTNQNDDMEEKVKDIPRLRVQLKVRASDVSLLTVYVCLGRASTVRSISQPVSRDPERPC